MIEWRDNFLDGDWLLVFEAGEPERYTIADREIRAGTDAPGLLEISDRTATIRLAAGRTITLLIGNSSGETYSATVTEIVEGEAQSEPAMWLRA